MKMFFILCFAVCSIVLFAHEGHHEAPSAEGGRSQTLLQWIGSFHLIFLHFPIALINMVVVAEILSLKHPKPIFEFSSRFMLIAAAILAPITAMLGLIYSFSTSYSGLMETFLFWHMWLGILTSFFTIVVLIIREQMGVNKLYYASLTLLFLMINITGYFGGGMTFGPYHMLPPT